MTSSDHDKAEIRAGERIAKVMARAGLCSRRDAETWIAAGRVTVNGQTLTSPAFNVSPEDDVRVDGERLREAERTRLFFFHKPRGLVTTARDPEGRPTVFDVLPKDLPRVVTIGRLDINTEGLLLLTNDGGLARVLELPTTGWLRRYRVRAHGEVTQEQLDALAEGVTVDGVHYAGIQARLERPQGSNVWLTMGLREGKNREIKRVLEHLGLAVTRLIRVSFGPFELGDLPEGEVAELSTRVLVDQLGVKLAKQAGANFDAPIEPRRPLAPKPGPERGRGEPRPGADRGDRPRRAFAPKEDRAEIARELASRGERPETVKPRKRKHISILRAEARAEAEGPRKRIERSATSDRRGREVKIERIKVAREPEAAPVAPRAARRGKPGANFERSGPKREFAGKREFRGSREGPGEGRPERASRPFRDAPKPRDGEGRPARSGPRREFSDKREISGGRDRAPERSGRPFGAGPKFGGGGGGREAREARPEGPARNREFAGKRDFSGKRESGPAREGRPFREGPRREGGKPSGSGRPSSRGGSGGKPTGRPGGKRPPGRS